MLIQRRAEAKYHSGGLWANACCSHPLPDEAPDAAALRRLSEELGVTTLLRPLGVVAYRAEVGHGLVEDEVAHLFLGRHAGDVRPDPDEVSAWAWVGAEALLADVAKAPHFFAPWFRIYLHRYGSGLFGL
jgi:Isopentenyldiphosphate isomerase